MEQTTTIFRKELEGYRFEGSYQKEDGNIVALNAHVWKVSQVENTVDTPEGEEMETVEVVKDLGFVNLYHVSTSTLSDVFEDVVSAGRNLLTNLLNKE